MTDFSKLPQDIIIYINLFIRPIDRYNMLCMKYGNLFQYVKTYLKDKKTLSIILFNLTHLFNGYYKACYCQAKPLAISSIRYNLINILTRDFIFQKASIKTMQRKLYCIEQIIKRKYGKSIYTSNFKWRSGFELRNQILIDGLTGKLTYIK